MIISCFISWLNRNLIFVISSVLHLTWAVILFLSTTPLHTTAIDYLILLTGSTKGAAAILFISALAAFASLFHLMKKRRYNFYLFLPQQFLLIMSALATISCIVEGHFADQSIYPRSFIALDQSWTILWAIAHLFSLWFNFIYISKHTILHTHH